jgi:hypothetical protein
MFLDVLKKLEGGYLTTFYYDCTYFELNPDHKDRLPAEGVCEPSGTFNPHFHLSKPPEYKYNPYTGKEMERILIQYPTNQVSVDGFKSWITKNIPDFSKRLATVSDYQKFSAQDGISKVYLLSAKSTPSPIYSALTSNFRDRVLFAFSSEQKDTDVANLIKQDFSV